MTFQLQHLDHIAIRVRNIEESAKWYEEVLGLKRIHPKEWGGFPIMMLAGNSGIAIFPSKTNEPRQLPKGDWITAFHFAFRVSQEDFEKVQTHLAAKKIPMEFQNLVHFNSIFIHDPDGYHVEITTQVRPFHAIP